MDAPEWEPLLNLAPDHVVDFMWMGTEGRSLSDLAREAFSRYMDS